MLFDVVYAHLHQNEVYLRKQAVDVAVPQAHSTARFSVVMLTSSYTLITICSYYSHPPVYKHPLYVRWKQCYLRWISTTGGSIVTDGSTVNLLVVEWEVRE